jgi:hypothetical protein
MSKIYNEFWKVIYLNLLIFLIFYDCELNNKNNYGLKSIFPEYKSKSHYSCLNQTGIRNDPQLKVAWIYLTENANLFESLKSAPT